MGTTVREYSLDYYLLDRMKFCGIERENLEDLVSIVASIKNKYGIAPFDVTPIGQPVLNGLTARYLVETIALDKLMNVLLDSPRLTQVSICRAAFPGPTNSR